MRRIALALFLIALPLTVHGAVSKVTLLHFSDYHSHALPFYSEERADQGGIARAVTYLRREKRRGAIVLSGGDMVNQGSPAWSDKYHCVEWPWLNGLVDAMAFGNHDPDYGPADFEHCRRSIRYPMLSANTAGFQRYEVLKRGPVRIGVFAVAGPDFPSLVRSASFIYTDRIAAAREVVRILREVEHVDAVVLIGHEHLDDDFALARAVPGIDVIFGSHSHLKRDWQQIPGTSTWFISPFQYLTYVSRVTLTFDGHRLRTANGVLERMDKAREKDPIIEGRVASLERKLEADPQYASLFQPIGKLATPLSVEQLGALAVETMRKEAHTDLALSTKSSFRQSLPSGALTMEQLRAAMPYDNEIVTATVDAEEAKRLIEAGGEFASYLAGSLDGRPSYTIALTDYLASAMHIRFTRSGLRAREVVIRKLKIEN